MVPMVPWVSPRDYGAMAYGAYIYVPIEKWGFTYVACLDFSGKDARGIHATGLTCMMAPTGLYTRMQLHLWELYQKNEKDFKKHDRTLFPVLV